MSERIVAVALLTQEQLDLLGPTLKQVWPTDGTPCFDRLLHAIDEQAPGRIAGDRTVALN